MSVQHGARVGRNGHFFNDPKKVDYFERIKQESQHLLPSTPIHGPVVIKYAFFHERPKRLLKKSSPEGAIPMDQKPDYDNLAKGLSDGLTRAGFLKDDKQIWAAFIFSMYREITLFPRIEIQIFYERTKTSPKGAKISRDEQAGKPSFRFTHK
jgi:Holliday junction resolvase RusA-like endonuclease